MGIDTLCYGAAMQSAVCFMISLQSFVFLLSYASLVLELLTWC